MEDVWPLVVFLAVAAVLFGIVPLLQWLGRLPPGNPQSLTQRTYIFLPWSAGLLVIAAAVLLGETAGEAVTVAGLWIGLLLMFLSLVLVFWTPRWLRPRWQKEYMAEMGYHGSEAQAAVRRRAGGGS